MPQAHISGRAHPTRTQIRRLPKSGRTPPACAVSCSSKSAKRAASHIRRGKDNPRRVVCLSPALGAAMDPSPRRSGRKLRPARLDARRARSGEDDVLTATPPSARQTERTAGTSCATCTHGSGRRACQETISPRSVKPTASAGVLVTVRMAFGRSISGNKLWHCRCRCDEGLTVHSPTRGCPACRPSPDPRWQYCRNAIRRARDLARPSSHARRPHAARRPLPASSETLQSIPHRAIACLDMFECRVIVAGRRCHLLVKRHLYPTRGDWSRRTALILDPHVANIMIEVCTISAPHSCRA